MAFQYTRSQLKSDINQGLRGKIGMIADQDDFVNRIVREVNDMCRLRSARRRTSLTPDIFTGVYQYASPTDLRDYGIIDIPAQAKRSDGSFTLVPVEQFNVNPQDGDIAIDTYNGVQRLWIKSEYVGDAITISPLDSLTSGGGTWVAFGDAENLASDTDDYMHNTGSISFDISAAGGTTAGIVNTGLDSFDITDYLGGHSAVFVWVRINSATNLTNFILRLGSDSSNYYSKTITTRHDGTAFQSGWNLLRFDLTSLTETGTVDTDAMQYVALYMTKDAAKVSETDYKFDHLTIRRGKIHEVLYQSKYGWTTSSGVWIENSTDDGDFLVADTSEYQLFVRKGIATGRDLTNFPMEDITHAEKQFDVTLQQYQRDNPDESVVMITQYYKHATG